MLYPAFQYNNIETISEALDIAEDKTGDYYKFSFEQWKRHRYDVKTLRSLNEYEISSHGFALLNRYSSDNTYRESRAKKGDFYFICLQDHHILDALIRDENLILLSLLVYVFTHELVHIVRFCNFHQRYEISGKGKENEERLVHATTYDILKDISLPRMDYILDSYQDHRICDLALS